MIGNDFAGFGVAVHGSGHHSLVTPIDWKPSLSGDYGGVEKVGHHSLVTPIDWKPF